MTVSEGVNIDLGLTYMVLTTKHQASVKKEWNFIKCLYFNGSITLNLRDLIFSNSFCIAKFFDHIDIQTILDLYGQTFISLIKYSDD